MRSWLRPVARLEKEYKFFLDTIADASRRLDALCELNVIEQVTFACRTKIVQTAWRNGRELSVSGLIYDRENLLLPEFRIDISGQNSVSAKHREMVANFERRWTRARNS